MTAATTTQNEVSWAYRFLNLTVLGAFVLASLALNGSLVRKERKVRIEESPDSAISASFRWHPELYRLLAFGHVPASVDWLLIRFLVDTNLSKVKNDQETEAFRILNLATDLDPAFHALYYHGANFLAVARDDKVGALRLLEKAEAFMNGPMKSYPEQFRKETWANSWRLFHTKGYLFLFEFQDARRAAEAYARMAEFPDAPTAIRIMAQNNQSPEGQFNLAANSITLLKRLHPEDEIYQGDLIRREKFLLTAKDLVIWNRKLREIAGRRRPSAADFAKFRREYSIPSHDRLGGEIFLNSGGSIDSRTPKIPTLGTDLEAVLKEAK